MGSAFSDLQGSAGYKDKSRRAGRKDGVKTSGGVSVVDPSGVPADMIPAALSDVPSLLPAWVSAWCDENIVQDIRKASAQVFRALCMDIRRLYVKPSGILKDDRRAVAGAMESTCNRYDPASVMALYDVFSAFCARCDKIPFGSDFACFCGVSVAYIKEYNDLLTSKGLQIAQKTHAGEIDAIRRRTSYFPVGGLAILNNELYGCGMISGGSASVTVDSIPTAGGFKALEQKPID